MRMLAQGRFWMPAIPLPEFFDSFYVLVKPVYASMYFPGTAIMYVPALLLHLPYIVAPLAASGLCAAMLYLIFTEILDGASAILGSVASPVPVDVPDDVHHADGTDSDAASGIGDDLGGASVAKKELRDGCCFWGRHRDGRPSPDRRMRLCFAIVLGSVMAMDMCRKSWPDWVKIAAWIIAAALPFLILQLVLNRQITGQWLTTPFGRYNDINYPGAFGFHGGSAPLHVSDIPEKQLFYEKNVKWLLDQHQLKKLIAIGLKDESGMVARFAIVDPFFWIIAPISLLAMWNRRLWMVWGMLPVFLLVMSAYAFSWDLSHYYVMVMPATILLSVLPIRFLTDTFPNRAAMIRTDAGNIDDRAVPGGDAAIQPACS